MIIKRSIFNTIHANVPSYDPTKGLHNNVGQSFTEYDKVGIGDLMSNFISAKYDNSGWVRGYILMIVKIATS